MVSFPKQRKRKSRGTTACIQGGPIRKSISQTTDDLMKGHREMREKKRNIVVRVLGRKKSQGKRGRGCIREKVTSPR